MHAKITLKTIPVDRIDANLDQPRKEFDQTKLEELARSLATRGQRQPISVVYKPDTRRYMLISGERRWRAAQMIGLAELHAQVHHDVSEQDAFVDGLVENMARADMTPMEEGYGFHRLALEGRTHQEIGEAVGKSTEYVKYRIDLLALGSAGREALTKGHITAGTAWYLCKLSGDGQAAFLRKLARGEFARIADADAFLQAVRRIENNVQVDMFAVPGEPDEERREKIAGVRRRVTSNIDRLGAAGQILFDLAAMDAAELAAALEGAPGGVEAWRQRVDHLQAAAGKASSLLRNAAAIAAARTVALNPNLAGDTCAELASR